LGRKPTRQVRQELDALQHQGGGVNASSRAVSFDVVLIELGLTDIPGDILIRAIRAAVPDRTPVLDEALQAHRTPDEHDSRRQ
jgi:hypothetical protein